MIIPRIIILLFTGSLAATVSAQDVNMLVDALAAKKGAGHPGWSFLSAHADATAQAAAKTGAIVLPNIFEAAGKNDVRWSNVGGRVATAEPSIDGKGAHHALAAYTVPAGAAGFYTLTDTFLRRDAATPGEIDLRVFVRRANAQPAPVVVTTLGAGELFDFDCFLGYLDAGDMICVAVGPAGDATGDRTGINFRVERAPFIPVSEFPSDIQKMDASSAWSLAGDVAAGSPAARALAWGGAGKPDSAFKLSTGSINASLAAGGNDRETIASYRAPQSGYYALHDAWFAPSNKQAVEARIYVGSEKSPRRTFSAQSGSARASLSTDIGYVAKGDAIHIAFAAAAGASVDFAGSIVEWAPRRAPLRVKRNAGTGFLDVFEPEAQRAAIAIPAENWITVPAPANINTDATKAIRDAFKKAQSKQGASASKNAYMGVRLETGKTYTVASKQTKGAVFEFKDAQRIIFDGNGATLRVNSPELARTNVDLFFLSASRDIVFADCTVTSTSIPFTMGEILKVASPDGKDPRTVTFRVDEGGLDPLKDIARNGKANAYAYDAKIPGRLALGTWTHFPGSGDPSIKATGQPGVFEHTVTRTGNSIRVGDKWLVKNKVAGVIYLVTRDKTENITLSGINGIACGGGVLRFWQTSGVNILDCRFEPDGDNWISSSADGPHGRGREGVWIENTLIRGVCEDIMNTYGQNMTVFADANPADAVMTIYMRPSSNELSRGKQPWLPTSDNAIVGDSLIFFNPNNGRIIGQASVVSISYADGSVTLSEPISGIVQWSASNPRASTVVYNTRVAGRFFVRDTRFMDSMRFGIYIKARGGVVFGSQFEGLSGPSIFAANEPEWPEGPPATHLWVQGCTFSQNNYGYMPRNRANLVVDPADISVYTRRFRAPDEKDGHRAHLTEGQYANSHMKFIGNVFHDWRGMGISVRNSRNVCIADNVFLPPVDDDVIRKTLAGDPVLARDGRGGYAAIHLDSVVGADVRGNSFQGLPKGDLGVARGADVRELTGARNIQAATGAIEPAVALSFDEWFGSTAAEGRFTLNSAQHRAGRLGGGLHFAGGAPATLAAAKDFGGRAFEQLTLALWACPDVVTANGGQTIVALGDAQNGVIISISEKRWRATFRHDGKPTQFDLGDATPGQWRHIAFIFDGARNTARACIDGVELATATGVPASITLPETAATIGTNYKGALDELRFYPGVISAADLATLALRSAR